MNQFQAGTIAFTTVVVAEVALLADEEAELTARQNLFLASVSLIEALGGGWDTILLPTQVQLQKGFSFVPKLESPTPPVLESPPADFDAAADRAGRVATGTIAAEIANDVCEFDVAFGRHRLGRPGSAQVVVMLRHADGKRGSASVMSKLLI